MAPSSNGSGSVVSADVAASIQHFFDVEVVGFIQRLEAIAARIAPDAPPTDPAVYEQVRAEMQGSVDMCRLLESRVAGAGKEVIADLQARFRKATEHLFHQSWIAERAQTKPTGFPGDCQMLAALYNEQPLRTGIGGYIDAFIFNLPLAVAVRHRMRAAKAFLVEELEGRTGDVKVLDIASGPAREFVDWCALPTGGTLAVTCLDNDPSALQFVDTEVRPTLCDGATMQLERYNALRTKSSETNIRKFGRFDIIYSVGLADYIPDEPLVAMLRGWRDTLSEGGVMYVGFKDCLRYDKTPYQWHLDWHFLQRTEEECRELLVAAGYDSSTMKIDRDGSGIIVNFFCPAPQTVTVRIDSDHAVRGPVVAPTMPVNLPGNAPTPSN